jgi:hypothetical protein
MSQPDAEVIWIDDDIDHMDIKKNLEAKETRLRIEFIHADKNLSSRVDEYLSAIKRSPDLFLIDDKLPTRRGFNRRGLSVGMQIREKLPEVPIYLFSAYPRGAIFTTLAQAAEKFADELLDLDIIQTTGQKILYSDAIDYRRIRNADRKSVTALFTLLQVPPADHNLVLDAFPVSLRNGLAPRKPASRNQIGNAIEFGMWVRKTFLKLPGFVYDPLYSATKLGMTLKAFLKYSRRLAGARYAGVFCETQKEVHWWGSTLTRLVIDAAKQKPDEATSNVQKISRKVFNLKESQIAKCVVCRKEYPDTVGWNKYDESECQPVHYRCSIRHPLRPSALHFDQIRQFDRR